MSPNDKSSLYASSFKWTSHKNCKECQKCATSQQSHPPGCQNIGITFVREVEVRPREYGRISLSGRKPMTARLMIVISGRILDFMNGFLERKNWLHRFSKCIKCISWHFLSVIRKAPIQIILKS